MFANTLNENEEVNYFTYPYIYMGGGVAIGDINNDGLQDIYLTGNMVANKLYLNKGDMVFEDITLSAGVSGDTRWYTGVTFADVNGDGWQDIYVSVSGKWETTKNQLYINNRDLTFTESAVQYGVADLGQSTQGSFFDYDNDGDLDLYVVNYPFLKFDSPYFVYSQNQKNPKHIDSDHLYRNEGGVFSDVTEESKLLNFGLSLSATISDFNQDGLQDIYVSNDFAASDFFYFNNGDGTFTDKVKESTKHTAFYGMGADAVDFNNDGLMDFFQVDMTPADNFRSKANMGSMNPEIAQQMKDLGIQLQYMENAFQLNQGIRNDGLPVFGDVSRITGTALTDWSWSPLFFDFDNDGKKDLHVTNGSRRDINNKDYFNQFKEKDYFDSEGNKSSNLDKTLAMPSVRIKNYAYLNGGELSFNDVSEASGLAFDGYSNGSAYGDLDNDGDVDLVVNNIDDPVSIYENKTQGNHFLRIILNGGKSNSTGIGSKVEIMCKGNYQLSEVVNTRGFQSASEPIIHFGVGDNTVISEVKVSWPNGFTQILKNVAVDQVLELSISDARQIKSVAKDQNRLFTKSDALGHTHGENEFNDFEFEVLLPHATSKYGPALAVGDVNMDGFEDVFIGGATGENATLFFQTQDEGFLESQILDFDKDAKFEDVGALFFDANGDGYQDLYVVSGGNEFEVGSANYLDRIYINDGLGNLVREENALPQVMVSGSRVKPYDYDNDGDLDLLVGGRMVPRAYGQATKTTLLRNDSNSDQALFTDVTALVSEELNAVGMVTDLEWLDVNDDELIDIILVGEWMPITILINDGGQFVNKTSEYGLDQSHGWWYSISSTDMDNDGDLDVVVGNLGKNYKYQAKEDGTFDLHINDFDNNGKQDIVLSYQNDGEKYPVRGRSCSSQQIPTIKNKFKDYNSFASATTSEVYTSKGLENAQLNVAVKSFASVYLEKVSGGFEIIELPEMAQISSINQTVLQDFNQDGIKDILLVGNLYSSEVETKRNDGSYGMLLTGDGKSGFKNILFQQSGFKTLGDAKDMAVVKSPHNSRIIVVNNDDKTELFDFKTND